MPITYDMVNGYAPTERPDMPSYLGPAYRDILQMAQGIKPKMGMDELDRLANRIEQGERNLSMAGELKELGGDPEKAMAPATEEKADPSIIQRLFDVLDVAGAPIRYGMAKAQGAPLYNKSPWGGDGKSKVSGSDIIRYLQDAALGGSKDTAGQRWARGLGGLAVDIGSDPVNYLSFGLGSGAKIGGKVLSKQGAQIAKAAAPAFNVAKDKKVAMDVIRQSLEAAAGKGQKVYEAPATRLFGQKIGPDPFSALGKGIKSGYSTLKEFSNPVNTESMGLARKAAGGIVSGVEEIGRAISTKFGLSEDYLDMRRAYEDQLNYANLTIKKEMADIFKKANGKIASKSERIAIARYIDDPRKFSVSLDLQPIVGKIKRKLAGLAKDLQANDLLDAVRADYIPHSIGKGSKKLPDYLKSEKEGGRLSLALGGAKEQRFYGTFSELFKAQPGLKSITEQDPAKILGGYWATAEKAKATKQFLDKVGGLSQTKMLGDVAKQTPLQERIAGGLTDWRDITDIPINIAKDLQRIDSPKYAKGFIGYRQAHAAWKGMVTAIAPGFHARNAASNQILSSLDVGKEMLDPRLYVDVVGTLANRQGKIATRQGLEYSYDDIRKLARELGVTRSDWGKPFTAVTAGKLPKTNPLEWGRNVGQVVENEGRMTNFIAHLRKGDAPIDAAKGVDRALFNYTDLTNADRAIKWVVPFWSFTRRHAELMGKTLITNPGRVTAEIRLGKNIGPAILGGNEVSQEDMKALPEFYQEGLKIARSVDKGTAVEILSGLGLPIEDLEGYPIFSGYQRLAQKVAGRVTPILKIPVELALDRDFFFGAPLSPGGVYKRPDGTNVTAYNKSYPFMKLAPQAVKDWLEYEELPGRDGKPRYTINSYKLKALEFGSIALAGATMGVTAPLIFSRTYRDIGKFTDTSTPALPRWLDALTGVRAYDLPGAADLRTRAAQNRTSQVGNLLSGELSKQKRKVGGF